jgi:hypothetical protein
MGLAGSRGSTQSLHHLSAFAPPLPLVRRFTLPWVPFKLVLFQACFVMVKTVGKAKLLDGFNPYFSLDDGPP